MATPSNPVPFGTILEFFELRDGVVFWKKAPRFHPEVLNEPIPARVKLNKRILIRSRVLWALHHGAWPTGHLRYVNGVEFDDRLENMTDQLVAPPNSQAHVSGVYGRLTVVRVAGRTKWKELLWECLCVCGNTTIVKGKALRSGVTKSCGCLGPDATREALTTHGQRGTRLYRIWRGVKERTGNPNGKDWNRWGGRGITLCPEWKEFVPFRDWALANGYADNLTIDRTNNDGNYEPGNCRWVSMRDNTRNSRNAKLTVEKAAEIRKLLTQGISQSKIAKQFGVCRPNISMIKTGRTWS